MMRLLTHIGFFSVVWCCFPTVPVAAQSPNLGLPPVTHFSHQTFKGGTQTWGGAQYHNGVVLLANNEGLLTFDGQHWSLHPVSNGTCVRSVSAAQPDTRIYVGAQGEAGFFAPDQRGRLQYNSLVGLLPAEERRFGDVWDVAIYRGAVFFRTNERIFRYENGQMNVVWRGGPLEHLATAGARLLVQSVQKGLLEYDGALFRPAGIQLPGIVTAFLPWQGDTILFTTLKQGIFSLYNGQLSPWATPADVFLKEKRIYAATVMEDGLIALGTTLGGLVVLQRNRKPLFWLRKGSGLQHNNILSVMSDRSGNLWLGLDNGIDLVEINAPLYRILPDGDLEGAGYAACLWNQRLYLGTSNGLYSAPWQTWYDPFGPPPFRLVSGSTGQVWSLTPSDDQLLMGHHEGAFAITGQQAQLLDDRSGTWKFLPLSPQRMIAGCYDGLSLFGSQNGHWQWKGRLEGFSESARILAVENDSTVWVSHPYRGVFLLHIDPNTRQVRPESFGKNAGLPSDLFNYIYDVGTRRVIAAEKGIFTYNAASRHFVPDTTYSTYLPAQERTRLLYGDPAGNVWWANGRQVGVLWVEDHGLSKQVRNQVFPQAEGQLVGGFEQVYSPDGVQCFMGTEQGFLYLHPHRPDTAWQVVWQGLSLADAADSVLIGGFSAVSGEPLHLSYQHNSIRVAFSATIFGQSRQVMYSSRLEGVEKEWSAWTSAPVLEYKHLAAGNYRLWVRARDESGGISAPVSLEWVVLPPWYAGPWARAAYWLMALGAAFTLWRWQQRTFEREKNALTQSHQEKEARHKALTEQVNQELVRVQNEKLAAEVLHKNEELALATMHLVQKGEVIVSIQEALERSLEKKTSTEEIREELRRLLRLLQADSRTDQDWEQFAVHFDQVHGNFLRRLREKYPQLSPNDYRLCAYLRMNLSTKEIAHLLNISVRGVEGSRYRLRRKMDLSNDENLVDFMMNI